MKKICVGMFAVAGLLAAGTTLAATGEAVYKQLCVTCHGTGVANAPKLGDKAAWAPRIKQGKEALYKSAISGKPGTPMVAKGGNASLSDADVKAAVDYMLDKSK